MTQEEILTMLENMGVVSNDKGDLSISNISDITFIHEDTGVKFKLQVD